MTDGGKKPEKLTRSRKPGQFAPSTSRNRGGQPAKKSMGIEECALAALQHQMETTLNGTFGWYSLAEIIGTAIAHDAAKGSKHAREMLIDFQAKSARPLENELFRFIWP